ncbi:class I SAM-dependent methyltransferase [Candidatus Woesearchaeota archaeon]|nr:class I SAM-dependent methyltransferase [Candidatus Woesearchaeota archaeon]
MHNPNTDKEKLAKRIETHDKYSKRDINKWIFGIIKIKATDSVLDVGCGTGKQFIPIAEKTKGLVVGVDLSEKSLNYVKSMIGSKPHIKMVLSSIEGMYDKLKHFPKFDVIISCFAIYYSRKPDKTITQLKGLLKENGRLFICGPGINNNKALLELHSKIAKLPEMHRGFFENFAVPFLKKNFRNVEVFKFENPVTFPGIDSLAEYWLSYSIGNKNKLDKFRSVAENEFKSNKKFTTVKEVIGILALK